MFGYINDVNTDILISGISGTAVGFALGYAIKKTMKIVFRLIMVIAVFWVGSIVYLQSIQVIDIRSDSAKNLVNRTVNSINTIVDARNICENIESSIVDSGGNLINGECIHQVGTKSVEDMLGILGIPMTTGLGLGFLLGWMKA
jgi:uncharacterized membrane protein (Fun14 family)